MKRFLVLLALLALVGCSNLRTNPEYEAIRQKAKAEKEAENAKHKTEQAKYDYIISHPEKFAETVPVPADYKSPCPNGQCPLKKSN